jgi:Ser/Thr protein kinase RdoA (MazF antagonist)
MNEIIGRYPFLKDCKSPQPFGNGHINDTYLLESPHGKFILQRVNNKVFRTGILTSNLKVLYSKLSEYERNTGEKLTPAVLKNNAGEYHSIDGDGAAWRVMEFFDGCKSYAVSPSEEISQKAAFAVGRFQRFLNSLPVDIFGDTIVNFHNLPDRAASFQTTLANAPETLAAKAKEEIEIIGNLERITGEFMNAVENQGVKKRVTHNDTKLDNILFTSEDTVLMIDLDTVMPGYIMFDYGDMVRTFTSPVAEDYRQPDQTALRFSHLYALTKGYLSALKNDLSDDEISTLFTGALTIIYEQAIRFLNDFLLGDIYYKTSFKEHNLVRARNQIKLLQDLIEYRHKFDEMIEELMN